MIPVSMNARNATLTNIMKVYIVAAKITTRKYSPQTL